MAWLGSKAGGGCECSEAWVDRLRKAHSLYRFIIEGAVSSAIAIIAYFVLVDLPENGMLP